MNGTKPQLVSSLTAVWNIPSNASMAPASYQTILLLKPFLRQK